MAADGLEQDVAEAKAGVSEDELGDVVAEAAAGASASPLTFGRSALRAA